MKVATNRETLIQNCHGLLVIDPKLSWFMSKRVAAARSPTTAGRKPAKTFCTGAAFMYFVNILLIRIMMMSDGRAMAIVAVTEPRMAIGILKPACCVAMYPQ